MKASRIGAAALLMGAILAAPAAAMADPWVSASSNGTIYGEGPNAGVVGQTIDIVGSGCINPVSGQPAYMGEFVSLTDPATDPNAMQFEFEADAEGGIHWATEMIADTTTYYARWYCSSAPVNALAEADLWIGPSSSLTFEAPAAPAARQAATTRTVGATTALRSTKAKATTTAAAAPAGSNVEVTVDPDALPALDRMGIVGPKAAQLKTKVDRAADASKNLAKLIAFLTGKKIKTTEVSNTEYVQTAYVVLTGKVPSAKVTAPFVARLDKGGLRVQVVEDIALTAHNASWWNTRN